MPLITKGGVHVGSIGQCALYTVRIINLQMTDRNNFHFLKKNRFVTMNAPHCDDQSLSLSQVSLVPQCPGWTRKLQILLQKRLTGSWRHTGDQLHLGQGGHIGERYEMDHANMGMTKKIYLSLCILCI